MSQILSRRSFLKRTAAALAALTLPPLPGGLWNPPLPPDDAASRHGQALGRITTSRLAIHIAPDAGSTVARYRAFDEVIAIYGKAEGPGPMAHNPVWFKTTDGYAYSSFVQPVTRQLNRPLLPSQVSEEKPALVEVTMPYTNAYRVPSSTASRLYRLYYATTHWVAAVERDESKKSWYKLRNDRGQGFYYVRAEHLKPLPAKELLPISPSASDKRIEINLTEQRLTAYEGDKAVLSVRVSTGAMFDSSDGIDRDFRTPVGDFRVLRKRASRHMQGGTWGIDYFDLPGVPWVTYFAHTGVALHGTYWHNDYGRQRSHGCVNLTPEQARWLYAWTEPAVAVREEVAVAHTSAGTPIRVFR